MIFTLEVDEQAINRAAEMAGATKQMVQRALVPALLAVQRSLEKRVVHRASRELRMPKPGLEKRFFTNSIREGEDSLRLWVGARPVAPFRLGPASVYGIPGKSGGVAVAGRSFPGAFLASIYSGRQKVWIRLNSKHYSPDFYPTKKRPGERGLAEKGLTYRFPVVRAAVPIDEVLGKVVGEESANLAAEFVGEFARQINKQNKMAANRGH